MHGTRNCKAFTKRVPIKLNSHFAQGIFLELDTVDEVTLYKGQKMGKTSAAVNLTADGAPRS